MSRLLYSVSSPGLMRRKNHGQRRFLKDRGVAMGIFLDLDTHNCIHDIIFHWATDKSSDVRPEHPTNLSKVHIAEHE